MLFVNDALATLRASKIPLPIIDQLLRHGLKEGEVCGDCAAWMAYLTTGSNYKILTKHYCRRAYSASDVPAETPACGKWHDKRLNTPPPDATVIQEEGEG